MILTLHDAKYDWTLTQQATFITLRGVLQQAPILHYPDPSKCYRLCMETSDDACGAQLSQENNGQELPVAFLLHTFTDTQCKWNGPKQETSGVYYAITKWNYYLQGSDIIMPNDHKLLQKFLNGKKC